MKKKTLFLSAFISALVFTACSENKGKPAMEGTSGAVENTVANTARQTFDTEGINKLAKKDAIDLSPKEIDFLLDQLEILVKRSEGMTSEEYRKFFKTLSGDEQEAMMTVAMQIAGAEKKGKLSEKQMKRNRELEERASFGK